MTLGPLTKGVDMRTTIIFICLCLSGSYAFAAENESRTTPESRPVRTEAERAPSLGVIGGITDTHQGFRNGTSYGAEYGWQTYIPFSAAVELSGYVSDHSAANPTLTRTRLLGKYNYNFGGSIPVIKDSYIGVGAGPVLDNVRNTNTWEVGIVPQIGFDIPIASTNLSLGANANYMFIIGPNANALAVNGVAKYWF
jgi:hypothetical protein